MDKITINGIEEIAYHEKLDNGLEVYMLPNANKNNIYATYTTRYGGIHNDFIPLGEKNFKKVPLGIAHFLEHKMFEQETGVVPFTFYSKSGTDTNASTGLEYTSYLFYGPNNFKDNLNYLLDFVSSPYFTDENVEKEKGIIEQEIRMYDDIPYWAIEDNIRANVFHKHQLKESIAGTVESIRTITKEDLYTCYNTFYHPSNMILIITGNFDKEEALNVVKDNFSKREYPKASEIKFKKIDEPTSIVKEYEEKEMIVEVPKIAMAIKIANKEFKNIETKKKRLYFSIFFDMLFGATSSFYERMRKENIVTSSIYYDITTSDDYDMIKIGTDSYKYKIFMEEVKKELNNIKIKEEDIERMKKVLISHTVLVYDSVVSINEKILNNILHYNKLYPNEIDMIKEINVKEMETIIKKIDFNNIATYVVKPINEIAE
jgi:predicted Zn-dependent peptidase